MDDRVKTAIEMFERGRFVEFLQLTKGIQDVDVLCLHALLKNDGMGCVKDRSEAEALVNGIVNEIKIRADNGNVVSQTNLGKLYEEGLGVNCDYAVSIKWYRKASEQGYARAQTNLGVMYANGRGVAKDEVLAVEWYRKAAEQGYADAQYNLGVMYANGCDVGKDEALAVEWYRKAAEQGYADALSRLELFYTDVWDAEANGSTAHLAYTLGLTGNLDDYPRLERLSYDMSGNTRRMVASALGKLACKLGSKHMGAINLLCRLSFEDDCPQVRQYALKALAKYDFRQSGITTRLKALANDMSQKPYVRVAAVALLSNEGSAGRVFKISDIKVTTSNLICENRDKGIREARDAIDTVTRGTRISGQVSDVDRDASKQINNEEPRTIRRNVGIREASGLDDIDVELSHMADVLWVQSVSPGGYVPPPGWSIKSKEVIAELKPCRYLVRRQGVTHFTDRENYTYDFIATLASVKIDGADEIHNVCFLPSQWDNIARQANVRDRIYIKAKWLEVPLVKGWVSRSRGREYFRGRLIYPAFFRINKCKVDNGERLPSANNLLALQLTGV